MYCECNGKTAVIDTVKGEDEIYRKRKCLKCGKIFYTVEFEVDSYDSIKENWNKYNRKKMKRSLTK